MLWCYSTFTDRHSSNKSTTPMHFLGKGQLSSPEPLALATKLRRNLVLFTIKLIRTVKNGHDRDGNDTLQNVYAYINKTREQSTVQLRLCYPSEPLVASKPTSLQNSIQNHFSHTAIYLLHSRTVSYPETQQNCKHVQESHQNVELQQHVSTHTKLK